MRCPAPRRFATPRAWPGTSTRLEAGHGLEAKRLREGDGSVCLLAVGKLVGACLDAAAELSTEGIEVTVWDTRVVSPPDGAMLADAARHALVITAEDGVRHGGAGAFLLDAMDAQVESAGLAAPATRRLGVPRQYIAQGRPDDILASLGLDGAGIAESVRRARLRVPLDR